MVVASSTGPALGAWRRSAESSKTAPGAARCARRGASPLPLRKAAPAAAAPSHSHRRAARATPLAASASAVAPAAPGTFVQGPDAGTDYARADWAAGYRSQPNEFAYELTDLQGTLPADLVGTYFRNGPGLFEIGGQRIAHPFDGDGLVSSIALQGGKAFFRCSYVKTEGYVAEQKAGKILFRNTFGTQRSGGAMANAGDVTQKNIANTNVVVWGQGAQQRCLALWEALQPHRLDPATLATRGLDTLNGLLKPGLPFSSGVAALDGAMRGAGLAFGGDPFTAHPHVDVARDRLVAFGYQVSPGAGSPGGLKTRFTFYEFDQDFKADTVTYDVGGFAFVHDFAFTENYYVFFQNPVNLDQAPFLVGAKCAGQCLEFDASRPTRVHLVPRAGRGAAGRGLKPVVLEMPACFVFHQGNAYEDGQGNVIVDSVRLPELLDFEAVSAGDFLNVDFSSVPVNTLWRHVLALPAGGRPGSLRAEELMKRVVEFPRINPSYFGKKHRFLYMGAARHPTNNQPLQAWLKHDAATGGCDMWNMGPRVFAGEPEFVARPGAAPGPEGEDDGYLVGLVYDAADDRSKFVVLDARNLAAGPLATLTLTHHLPYGLHGNWVDQYFGPAL